MKKSFRFNKLTPKAQNKARRDYKAGWLVTHPEDKNKKFDDDIISMFGYALFDKDGKYIGEVGQIEE